MKLKIIFLLITLHLPNLAVSYSLPTAKDLNFGECFSNPDAKLYLSSITARKEAYTKFISEIGPENLSKFQDNPNQSYYFCQLQCKDHQGRVEGVWVSLSDDPNHASNMNGFLCPFVSIENLQIVGSIYGPQPVAKIVNAYETHFPEVHTWLRRIDFKLSPERFNEQLKIFNQSTFAIIAAYTSSGSPILKAAGQRLTTMLQDTDAGHMLMTAYLERLSNLERTPVLRYDDPDYFVLNVLSTSGRFFLYYR